MKKIIFSLIVIMLAGIGSTYAHQPVMDMAPRWEEGYGFQLRHEHYGSDKLMDGDSRISNPLDLERYVHTTWLEGVYTFKRELRVTFKLPYVDQKRTKNIDGVGVRQSKEGIGDLIIGVPLKYYRNMGAFTDNFSFTPSVRLPTGTSSGDFPISDGSTDLGLSFSYSTESPKFYSMFDAFAWINSSGDHGMRDGNTYGLDVNLGYHPFHSDETNSGVFVMLDVSVRHNDDPSSANLTTASGGQTVQTGPVLVLYKDNIMFRAEYKFLPYERTSDISNSHGDEYNVGIGITF